MKNNLITVLACCLLFCACASIPNLPPVEKVKTSPYGSLISIRTFDGHKVRGELIAMHGDTLFISRSFPDDLSWVKQDEIEDYSLWFANGERLWPSIVVMPILPLIPFPNPDSEEGGNMPFHGWFMLYTVPINLIVTTVITPIAHHDYKLKNLSFDELKMYSRYPQGLIYPDAPPKEDQYLEQGEFIDQEKVPLPKTPAAVDSSVPDTLKSIKGSDTTGVQGASENPETPQN